MILCTDRPVSLTEIGEPSFSATEPTETVFMSSVSGYRTESSLEALHHRELLQLLQRRSRLSSALSYIKT